MGGPLTRRMNTLKHIFSKELQSSRLYMESYAQIMHIQYHLWGVSMPLFYIVTANIINSAWAGKVARRLHRKSTTVGRMIKKLYDDDMSLSPWIYLCVRPVPSSAAGWLIDLHCFCGFISVQNSALLLPSVQKWSTLHIAILVSLLYFI